MKVYIIFNIDVDYDNHKENDECHRDEKEVYGVYKTRKAALKEMKRLKEDSKEILVPNRRYGNCLSTEDDDYYIEEKRVHGGK